MVLLWVYELIEHVAVNNTGRTTNLKEVKPRWGTNFSWKLFKFRRLAAHKVYLINNADILDFFNLYRNYIELLIESPYNDIETLFAKLPEELKQIDDESHEDIVMQYLNGGYDRSSTQSMNLF